MGSKLRVLVTGSGGLIGRYLASSFTQNGWDVIALYRNNYPVIPDGLRGTIEYLQADLADGLLDLPPVDVIVHAAAHTRVIADSTTQDFIRTNVIGTSNLVEYAKVNPPTIFVYLSTVSMYGDVSVGELDESTPLTNPEMYGVTKYLGERVISDHAEQFPSVSIRLPGVVGPGYFVPWIGNSLVKAIRDEDITVYNPESFFNNVVDLEDLGRFIYSAIYSGLEGFEAVNLAADEPLTIREVAGMLVSLSGSKSKIIEQANDRRSFIISNCKVKSVFGFNPATTESIIHRYVTGSLVELKRGVKVGK
ncbi:NAD(P)-dependent oxidoreductase [SAR202 cluster bacterium AD-802-F09_MRT_200m]|nr:NAD(P)-dependent oxidoreductase [SAR202 cluster bacterium AD-802-F09_MRT_200m]